MQLLGWYGLVVVVILVALGLTALACAHEYLILWRTQEDDDE